MDKIEKLEQLTVTAKDEAEKFYKKGNKSAGTRLRKTLMEIKKLSHEIRADVTETKNG